MSSGREVTKIEYSTLTRVLGKDKVRCHVYTRDGGHYTGEGYDQDEARENALDVKRAND